MGPTAGNESGWCFLSGVTDVRLMYGISFCPKLDFRIAKFTVD